MNVWRSVGEADATPFLFSPERLRLPTLLGITIQEEQSRKDCSSSAEVRCRKRLCVPQVPSADETQQESPEATTASSSPPQTSPPSLPEMDFFHSDPFTDREAPQASPSLNYAIRWFALCHCITVILFIF